MGVVGKLRELVRANAFPSNEVIETFGERIFWRLNALYEGLLDVVAPGALTQQFKGHDHGIDGGSPLVKSSQLTLDSGSQPLWTATLTTNSQTKSGVLGPRYISHGLQSRDTFTVVAIYLRVTGGTVNIWCGKSPLEKVEVKPQGDEEDEFQWIFVRNQIDRAGQFSNLIINAESVDFQDTSIFVDVRSLDEAETWRDSAPKIGEREFPSSIGSIGTILRYFGNDAPLDDALVASPQPLDAFILKLMFMAANALYEAVYDRPAPGSTIQKIQGHDHSAQGGRPVPMGKLYSAGGATTIPWATATLPTINQWEYSDKDNAVGTRRTSGTPNQTTGAGSATQQFSAYVTFDIVSGGNPPTVNPYLHAKIQLLIPSLSSAEVRIYNKTINALSESIIAFSNEWIDISKIPCSGGEWNDFDIQIRRTSGSDGNFSVLGVRLFEIPSLADDTRISYTPSSGETILGKPRDANMTERSRR